MCVCVYVYVDILFVLDAGRAQEAIAGPSGSVSKAGKRAHYIQGQNQARGHAASKPAHCFVGI